MEEDPVHDEQLRILQGLLGRNLSSLEYEGFLIVGSRFVDRFGNSRIGDLARTFETDRAEGKAALGSSLSHVARTLGSYQRFAAEFPVTIIPALPSFPLFPIIGIETIRPLVYRVLDSRSAAVAHIKSTGRLPERPKPSEPVLRSTPRAHWCAYQKWETPEETRQRLQILPGWSDCQARATISTRTIADLCFVAYSVDPNDPDTRGLDFHGYFFEGLTQDHDELDYPGDAVQICVYGEPEVAVFEEWDANQGQFAAA
jgi:hypothetical protein